MKPRNFFAFLMFASGLIEPCFAQITEKDVTTIKMVVVDFEVVFGAVVTRCAESHPDHAPRLESAVHNWFNHNRNSVLELREMYPKLTKYFPEADRTGYQPTPKQIGNMMTGMFLDSIAKTDGVELRKACSGVFEEKTLKELDFSALLNKIKNEK